MPLPAKVAPQALLTLPARVTAPLRARALPATFAPVFVVMLVSGGKPLTRPVQWMRVSLFLLLVAAFLASASRNARQRLFEVARAGEAAAPSVRD